MTRWTLLYRVAVILLLAAIFLELRALNGAPSLAREVRQVVGRATTSNDRKEEAAAPASGARGGLAELYQAGTEESIQWEIKRERAERAASQPR